MKNTRKSLAPYRENVHWDFRREVHYPYSFLLPQYKLRKRNEKKSWLNAVCGNGRMMGLKFIKAVELPLSMCLEKSIPYGDVS